MLTAQTFTQTHRHNHTSTHTLHLHSCALDASPERNLLSGTPTQAVAQQPAHESTTLQDPVVGKRVTVGCCCCGVSVTLAAR